MALEAQLRVRRGDFVLDAGLQVGDGEVLALLGPNGSGKSTVLAALAGLIVPEAGRVVLGDRVLTRAGPGAAPAVAVPASRRRIGLLGQDPLLFPHLTALENVAFGPRASGVGTAVARVTAADWLDAVGLAGLAGARPSALSGGQQQRVAIARALAARPDVLLLDEPMASLDVQTASLIRTLLRDRIADSGVTTVLVTHDAVDAIVLADRVAILDDGRVVDVGDTARVLGEPVNLFAATLVGLNLLHGTVTDQGRVRATDGRHFVGHGELPPAGTRVAVVFPPSAVTVLPEESSEGGVNRWVGTVAMLEPAAGGIRILLVDDPVVAQAPPRAVLAGRVTVGSVATVSVDPAFVTVYPATPTLG
jgi:molybdate transport system ATP-binding protein